MIVQKTMNHFTAMLEDQEHRYRSWENCYLFFRNNRGKLTSQKVFDHASLHLGFYLASWGMMRGSSFLLQKDYHVHMPFIKEVAANPDFDQFYDIGYEGKEIAIEDIYGLDQLINATRNAYVDNIKLINGNKSVPKVSDTLASKILLGVFGCTPAYDRYFCTGIKMHNLKPASFRERSIINLILFSKEFHRELNYINEKIVSFDQPRYPLMKLIDMYFWQVGYMLDNSRKFSGNEIEALCNFANQYQLAKEKIDFPKGSKPKYNIRKKVTTDDIRHHIKELLLKAQEEGETRIKIVASSVHKQMGLENRYPMVCSAMRSVPDFSDSRVVHETASRNSCTYEIEYFL